jgi:hypothetical protein
MVSIQRLATKAKGSKQLVLRKMENAKVELDRRLSKTYKAAAARGSVQNETHNELAQ